MIDSTKLQYYTMSHRLRGFAEGLEEGRQNEALINMLNKAAALLEHAWDDYEQTLPHPADWKLKSSPQDTSTKTL